MWIVPKLIDATSAKNRFGEILKMAEKEPVYIVKHGKPSAVVVSASQFETLATGSRTRDEATLDALRNDFNKMYAQMQHPRWRKDIDLLVEASADELNKVAARRMRSRAKKSR